MMGKKKCQAKLMYNITLEDLVPGDNFYRRLEKLLDLRFIYQECKSIYGKTGNPSIDPVVFFKLILYGYFENIISDRELIRRATDSLSVRLYLGYDIDEELPWHSTISRTRAIMDERIFEKLFTIVLGMCIEAGFVSGKHQSIDSTLVKANASLESLERKAPKLELKEYIKETKKENQVEDEKEEIKSNLSSANSIDKKSTTDEKLKIVKTEKGKKREKCSNKDYISSSDPDSRIAKKPGKPTDLYYTTHYSVDSKNKIITDVLTTHADISDSKALMEVVNNTTERLNNFGLSIDSISADRNYCSGENLREIEEREIQPFIPAQKHPNTTGCIGKDKFRYNKEEDFYVCPNNKILRYRYTTKKKSKAYSCSTDECSDCPLRAECTKGRKSRQVYHSIYLKEYERLELRMNSQGGKEAMRLRKTGPEPLFAEAKMYHGLWKFMTRGKSNAQKNSFIIATVQNLKRLMKYFGRTKKIAINFTKNIVNVFSFYFKLFYYRFDT